MDCSLLFADPIDRIAIRQRDQWLDRKVLVSGYDTAAGGLARRRITERVALQHCLSAFVFHSVFHSA